METALVRKYNVAAPRYTSYPTVPYWNNDGFSADKWIKVVQKTYSVHASEGISLYIHLPFCESLCTYCGCNTRITRNHAVEVPYISALLKEWEMYLNILGDKPKIKELHLGGGTPTFFSPVNLQALLSTILSQATLAKGAQLSFEAHPANTSFEHLKMLYELGFRRLSLGIQDFDPKVQMMINRFQTPEQVAVVVQQARDLGYHSVNFDLIYGLPAQNVTGLTQTIQEVAILKPDRIAFYSYAHVPWLKPGQRHFTEKDLPVGEEKYALYQKGRELLLAEDYYDVGMDHFALETDALFQASEEKKLHRNFMGYTDQHTHLLIGLGVSSISDGWMGFAQNPKTVEAYLTKIESGCLPVEKGHILTADDLEVRIHILNMMCRDKTFFVNGISNSLRERLSPLLNDGLISFDEKSVGITQLGKSYIRNVCMAFDEKLWAKQTTNQVFSSSI